MKDTDHLPTGIPFTSAVNGSFGEPCGCNKRDVLLGRGQNTGLGWSDPTFGGLEPPKDTVGSLQPSVPGIARALLRQSDKRRTHVGH